MEIGKNEGQSSSDDEDKDLRLYGAMQDTVADVPKVRPGLHDAIVVDDDSLDRHGGKSTSRLLPSQRNSSQGSLNSAGTHVSTRSTESIRWYHHPKIRENWKVVVGSILLTVVGLVMCLVGVGILISPDRGLHCLVFFIGGLLCLIPGAYHVVYIYLAVKGYNGYSLYNLPVLGGV